MHVELSTAVCQKRADSNAVYRHRSLQKTVRIFSRHVRFRIPETNVLLTLKTKLNPYPTNVENRVSS